MITKYVNDFLFVINKTFYIEVTINFYMKKCTNYLTNVTQKNFKISLKIRKIKNRLNRYIKRKETLSAKHTLNCSVVEYKSLLSGFYVAIIFIWMLVNKKKKK
jgi:hypothetical protein